MLKKIIISIFLFSIPLNSFAGGCPIKSTPEFILDYIKNNELILANISNAKAIETSSKSVFGEFDRKYAISRSLAETEGVFNTAFSFRSYGSYFKFHAVHPMLNEIPEEVKRDYKLLQSQLDAQIEFLKKISKEGKGSYIVENPCVGIDGICNFKKGKTVKSTLGDLMKNTNDVIDAFRRTVTGETFLAKVGDYHLVKNNFKLELDKNYSPRSYNLCNGEGEGFYVKVKEGIEQIKGMTNSAEDGIDEWREAWAMLFDTTPSEESDKEKELLKEYLSEAGIKTDDGAVINKNLEKYNLESLSVNNHFIENTFKVIENNIAKEIEQFKKEVLGDFTKKEEISKDEINLRSGNAIKTQEIQARIVRLYESELPFASISDSNTETLRAKIIESHSSLDVGIRVLNRAIPKAQKICNSQGGGGLCK